MTTARESSRSVSSSGMIDDDFESRLVMFLTSRQEAASSFSNICNGWPGMIVEMACL
jgi:hypothetical protein